MYNPRLKDKHALVDLARYGTEARKSIHPDVLIGEHCVKCPPFREGDILDANATVNLIGDTLNCCEVFQTFDEEGQRIAERLDNLEQTQSENYTELSDKVDSLTETHEQDIARLDDKTDNLAQNIINQERVVDISKQSEVDGKTSYLVTKQDGSHDTIIVTKGDKGDQGESFSYEDFTPEQLEALKVKGDKGDKGTSITRVQQTTVAYNDRGVNIVTIDLDDGSSSQIQIRNGAGGGDSSQVRQDLQAEIARATSAENALQNNINSVNSRVDHIVEDAPEALDTLLEIAEKLHDEEDAVAALTLEISQKYTKPAGGIPSSDMSEAVRTSLSKADTALQEHQDISGKADLADLAAVATTGEYSDLLNKPVIPTIPTNVSAFTNDAGYLTEHQDISGKANVADLAAVATSGSYNDLIDKPAIPSLDGYATEQWVQNQNYLTEHQDISGKANTADLSSIAFSGDYEDLSNTPTIPTVPTNVSAFTNDAGYLTQHQDISGKQDVISDLDTIRSGAQAGSTALQPSALNDYYNKTQVDNKLSEKQDTISDLATIRTGAGMGATALQPSALNNYYNKDQVDTKLSSKQDIISNLATIEAGAAKGATSLQPSDKGVANGVATLNENGIIPSSQLPSYVDDVLEYESSAEFPVTGESGKIYIDLLTNKTYRWGGSGYVEISESLALGETSSTAYAGNKGKATTDAFNAHAANTDIHVTAAKQAAWDAKADVSYVEDNYLKNYIEVEVQPEHDYVEIGGIKWATMNVGANSVTDTGLYFQWGDTQGYTASQVGSGSGQKYFGWADYKYGNGTSSPVTTDMTKYNATDGKTVLDASDDAVTAAWGSNWRMPTGAEYAALGNAINTAWTEDYQGSGVAGMICTDKNDSSKVLFFPAGGYCYNGEDRSVGLGGYYWSSSLDTSDTRYANYLYTSHGTVYWEYDVTRHTGYPVRGVYDGPTTQQVPVQGVTQVEKDTWNTSSTQQQVDWNQTDTTAVDYIKNKPIIPAAQVNSDWNASSGVAQILNKPTIPSIWTGTQVQYDAIATKDPDTIYIITSTS